jgi:hypothetical protein
MQVVVIYIVNNRSAYNGRENSRRQPLLSPPDGYVSLSLEDGQGFCKIFRKTLNNTLFQDWQAGVAGRPGQLQVTFGT